MLNVSILSYFHMLQSKFLLPLIIQRSKLDYTLGISYFVSFIQLSVKDLDVPVHIVYIHFCISDTLNLPTCYALLNKAERKDSSYI